MHTAFTPSSAAIVTGLLVAAAVGCGDSKDQSRFRISLSVSPFSESVVTSLPLTDGVEMATHVGDVQRLLNRHGATEVFVRVATLRDARSGDAEYGFARAIERATLAKNLDMPLNPELGLWAVYGDIRDQPSPDFSDYPSIQLPAPWSSLSLGQMESALEHYGALAAQQILSTGVRVNYWDLGNEVEFGVAGVAVKSFGTTDYTAPDAVDPAIGQMTVTQLLGMPASDRIDWLRQHLWPHVGRLLAAAARGVRSVDAGAKFSTHLAGIGVQDATFPVAFWTAMNDAGYAPDQLGTSLYPTAGDSGDRRAILLDVASTLWSLFGKQTFVAEFGYPSGVMAAPYAWNNAQAGYPQTPDGQFGYLRDLVVMAVDAGTVGGIRPWAADYCIASGGWEPMSFFTAEGSAKPALDAVEEGLHASPSR